ncbi:ferrous iron transport protein A [Candidatus Woesearchaeota archaeon]|nr:ferrous iron transport protein A [Candidatus Woesearchaeota archaeon]
MEIPLSKLKSGEIGIIKQLRGGLEFQRTVNSLGVIVGKRIKVISVQPLMGPVVISMDNMQIAIGRGMATKIIIKQ